MAEKNEMVSLKTWLITQYGEDAPSLQTARKWIREDKIRPRPSKYRGRYFLSSLARYEDSIITASMGDRHDPDAGHDEKKR